MLFEYLKTLLQSIQIPCNKAISIKNLKNFLPFPLILILLCNYFKLNCNDTKEKTYKAFELEEKPESVFPFFFIVIQQTTACFQTTFFIIELLVRINFRLVYF